MPYRSRGRSRTYYRRRPRRKTMWARIGVTIQDLVDTSVGVVDLLYWLKNPTKIPAARIPGFNNTGLNPAAIVAGQWPAQPTTGSTILRVLGNVTAQVATGPVPWQCAIGMQVQEANVGTTDVGTMPIGDDKYRFDFDPASALGMQTADWMMWKLGHPLQERLDTATGIGDFHIPFDVRAKRKIEDWGDTLYLYISPSGATADYLVNASVLLALP